MIARHYVYRGDGKCVRGRGAMLVLFAGEAFPRVVLARQLRKTAPPCQTIFA